MINIVNICETVLNRLFKMDYEKDGSNFLERLIFPNKKQSNGDIKRISEQELRLLFIEEFKNNYRDLFYSIETPTIEKYSFGKKYEDIRTNPKGQSASIDMCIFQRNSNGYRRILNIEFKYKNTGIENMGKDVLKLINEPQDGAFILLLDNTNSRTLCNASNTGVFNKLYKSFLDFKNNWSNNKFIQLIIMSLKENVLIHREINKSDLNNLKNIFFIKGCGNIETINGNGWNKLKHEYANLNE